MTADSAACDTGQVTQDSYYSPERVKALLRLYPYLADSKPPTDPELAGLSRKVFGPDARLYRWVRRVDREAGRS